MPKRSLTPKQRKLAKALTTSSTVEEAAVKAGYSGKRAAWAAQKAIAKRCPRSW